MKKSEKRKAKSEKLKFKAQNAVFLFLILSFSLLIFRLPCYAAAVSSTELINNAKQYDGKTVVYSGEVIGDVMRRGKFAWVNVNDGVNAIGIWLPEDLAKDINYTGSYKFVGDSVEVEGVFHRSCIEHGGDLDIHAASLHKTKFGAPAAEKINPLKIKLAIILLGALCLILILMRLMRR